MTFTWSYSKIKNWDVCPKKHYEVDIAKNVQDDTTQLKWGNEVHDAMAKACAGKAPLPADMLDFQPWVDRVRSGPGELLVEQKYALTRDLQPTEYFSPRVWYRGIGDVVRVDGPVALVLDWKTGKILVDSVQLALMAQCIFSFHPDVKRVRSEFVWLKEGDNVSTPEIFDRADMPRFWVNMLPRIEEYQNAINTMNFPPKPGKLCFKYCPVLACPFCKKRN